MQQNPFYEVMDAHSNEKLLDIVENKRFNYQPEAIEAAEAVLRNRKVKFREDDEVVVMTVEEIDAEVISRYRNGESFSEIKADFESKGVNIDELKSDYEVRRSTKARIGGFALVFIIGAMLIVMISQSGNKIMAAVMTGVLLVVVLFFLLRKRS